jgi:hypothetical protein
VVLEQLDAHMKKVNLNFFCVLLFFLAVLGLNSGLELARPFEPLSHTRILLLWGLFLK